MYKGFIILILCFIEIIQAKEIFREEYIKRFLTEENPHVYSIIGKKYIYKGKLTYYEGFLDTNILTGYEKKNYPLSDSLYYNLFLEKPTISGVDFNVGYRKAKGVQEYNNIKTGKNGEILLGVKIPIIPLIKGIDERRLNLYKTSTEINQLEFEILDKYRQLYYKILISYYKVLYFKQVLNLEKELLKKAEKRKKFIIKKIKEGILPEISLIEAQQHVINRKQRILKAKNNFLNSINTFLRYINVSEREFFSKYQLPNLPEIPKLHLTLDEAINIALQNRPDLRKFSYIKEIIKYETDYYSLLKYPKIKLDIYGVSDFKYKNGFKITLNANYQIERRKYLGKMIELKRKLALLDKEREKLTLQIKNNLQNIIVSLKTLKKAIKNSENEIELVKKIEEAEKRKFDLGRSNLFYLNQREIYTVETINKNLKYKLDYILYYQKLLSELNLFDIKPYANTEK